MCTDSFVEIKVDLFIKTGENQGMARYDMYQSLVDLLGLLVTANYKDLPSLQELTKMDSVRYMYL